MSLSLSTGSTADPIGQLNCLSAGNGGGALSREKMAGVVGLEPTVHGTKNRCLTCLATPQRSAKISALPAKRQEATYRRLSVENQSLRLALPAVIRRCDAGRLAWPIALLFAVSDWLDAL